MDAELLDAEEVLACRDAGGDVCGVRDFGGGLDMVVGWKGGGKRLTAHVPLGLAAAEGWADFLDLLYS